MNNLDKIYFLLETFDLWDENGEFTFPDGSYIARDSVEDGSFFSSEEEESTVEDLINSAGYWDRYD
jgi:hypothetical protein